MKCKKLLNALVRQTCRNRWRANTVINLDPKISWCFLWSMITLVPKAFITVAVFEFKNLCISKIICFKSLYNLTQQHNLFWGFGLWIRLHRSGYKWAHVLCNHWWHRPSYSLSPSSQMLCIIKHVSFESL